MLAVRRPSPTGTVSSVRCPIVFGRWISKGHWPRWVGRLWQDILDLQAAFDPFRHQYNFIRPHDALGLEVPASRYQVSLRPFPESLPPIEYDSGVMVRKVQQKGEIHFKGKTLKVGHAFSGYPVGLKAIATDGVFDVLFCYQTIRQINLREL